jgi:hypothetical protein
MQHCAGSDTQNYINDVRNHKIKLFSLRDSNNNPHCTIEYIVLDKEVVQIKGKQNKSVVAKYIPYVKDFLENYVEKLLDTYILSKELLNIGILRQEGKWYELNNLPNNFIIKDDFVLEGKTVERLPEGLRVLGNILLFNVEWKNYQII